MEAFGSGDFSRLCGVSKTDEARGTKDLFSKGPNLDPQVPSLFGVLDKAGNRMALTHLKGACVVVSDGQHPCGNLESQGWIVRSFPPHVPFPGPQRTSP